MFTDDSPPLEDGLEAENPLMEATIDSDSPLDIPTPSTSEPKLIPHEYKPLYGPNQKLNQKGTREIPVLYPSFKDMKDFPAYIDQIEKKGIHLESGIAKVSYSWLVVVRVLMLDFITLKSILWILTKLHSLGFI
jgi:hypothetical protein